MRKKSEIERDFAKTEALGQAKAFYLVGIGGAGMCSLAHMLKRRGVAVSGSDSTPSAAISELIASGIPVQIGHTGDGIREGDAVILSDAIDLDSNPEVRQARELGCPLFRRSQLLGFLLRGKKTIAVTGTHGKTTTTGMIGAALLAAGMDPTIIVGAAVPEFNGSVVEGMGEFAVVEACEAYDSFHDLNPSVVVITNLEQDHLDFHGTYANLEASVVRFAQKALAGDSSGLVLCCGEDAGARAVAQALESTGGHVETYTATDASQLPELALPGAHNRLNAAGAVAAAVAAGARLEAALRGVQEFRGAERRLQVLQEGTVTVVDDYAHHPTEIVASIAALKDRYPGRRLTVVFQPHLYSRTEHLVKEFAASLSGADQVVITDIYPAREDPIPGVSSSRIAERLTCPHDYVPSRYLLPRFVASMVRPGDVVCGMGAGNIADFAPDFMAELRRGAPKRIAVVYGGDSAEREVSLLSGRAVARALTERGYSVELIDVSERLLRANALADFVGSQRFDVAFLTVHGTNAEDGAIQGLMELLHVPYTGSGIQASAIAMDKQLAKTVLERQRIRVPKGQLVTNVDAEIELEPPLIVKPNAQGSTVGLSYVGRSEELRPALARALRYDGSVLVEEWVQGIEISVPVLGDRALPVVEIVPKSGRYDFESKYTPGATEEIVPARLLPEVTAKAQDLALRVHRAVGARGATRADMIVRGEEIVVLEINTIPGMTGTSLLPNSAAAAGIPFGDLVEWMVQDAWVRHGAKA